MSESMNKRQAEVARDTAETSVKVSLNLDGKGEGVIDTGIGFFELAIFHSSIGLEGINSGTKLIYSHIELGSCKVMFQSREEDCNLPRLHIRRRLDQFITTIFGIQV